MLVATLAQLLMVLARLFVKAVEATGKLVRFFERVKAVLVWLIEILAILMLGSSLEMAGRNA